MEPQIQMSAAAVPISDELLDEARQMQAAFRRWMTATPKDRAQWEREARERRMAERESGGPPIVLTLDGLLDKLGFSREYAEHLVQPYCHCGDGRDGWEQCRHAVDLGLRA